MSDMRLKLPVLLSVALIVFLFAFESPAWAASDAGSGHGAGAASGDPNPLALPPDLAWFTLVVFGLLLAVLYKFAWGPIREALEGREKSIADNIAAAEAKHEEARRLLAEHEERLSGTADQVRELLEEARRDAERTKSTILAEAQQAAQAERDRSLREVKTATDAALQAISERGADLAVELAGRIVQSELKADDHARLIRDAIGRLPDAAPSKN